MNSKIQQHMYTRARRSLYQQSEGYGTVAKTNGLADAFIKEKIHPYCVYPTAADSPPAVTVVHYPCGQMLLGQAVYVPQDFTGQRATFFAHNYILPPVLAAELVQDINKMAATEFLINETGELGELASLPTDIVNLPHTWQEFAAYVTACVQESVFSARKTYVLVPPDAFEYVWGFICHVFTLLPLHVKQLLGFCTFAREAIDRKDIHLVFVEKGAIRAFDPRHFVVDFCGEASYYVIPGLTRNLDENLAKASPKRFFDIMDLLHTRLPNNSDICTLEQEWLDINLDKLKFAQVPTQFLCRGNSVLHVMIRILKTCTTAISTGKPLDLRYTLGSYNLPAQEYFRVVKILRRLYQGHINDANMENIKFLFRGRGDGRLDENGLAEYCRRVI